MSEFNTVPVTEITSLNINALWETILKDIEESSFLSLDVEMSGLGCLSSTMKSNMDDRYAALCQAASTRSIISLGVACFKFVQAKNQEMRYEASVYNIILLCSEPYTIDPNAVKFLVEHGFDFNNQYAHGLPYQRGNDKPDKNNEDQKHSIRDLFSNIIRQRKPLVLHNGLADLIFLYNGFYAQCPSKLAVFLADLSELFPAGLYDTKYIAEFQNRSPASFLTFVFAESYQKNLQRNKQEKMHLQMEFKCIPGFSINVNLESTETEKNLSAEVCEKYSAYGWCRFGLACEKSHQISDIIRFHSDKKLTRKRKMDSNHNNSEQNGVATVQEKIVTNISEKNTSASKPEQAQSVNKSQGHRSGMDAFMTGYAFGVFIAINCKDFSLSNEVIKGYSNEIPCFDKELQKLVTNKLYISGKHIPLQICKSEFAKTSKLHNIKFVKIYLK